VALQGQQHLMTNIFVDEKVKRVGVKPTELGTAVCYSKERTEWGQTGRRSRRPRKAQRRRAASSARQTALSRWRWMHG